MEQITSKWTEAQILSEEVSKKDIVEFLHASASNQFLLKHKLNGKIANIVKTSKKPHLLELYKDLFATKDFRNSDEEDASTLKKAKQEGDEHKHAHAKAATDVIEEIKYTKTVMKKGTGGYKPQKGDLVGVYYKGMFTDGNVFDTNIGKKGKPSALKFKVGTGKVIRGWDEGLMTMVLGEKAKLEIDSEWAYGKKGMPDAGIAPNTKLVFEVELVSID